MSSGGGCFSQQVPSPQRGGGLGRVFRLRPHVLRRASGQPPVAKPAFVFPFPVANPPINSRAPHPHPSPPPSAGEGRERGASACGRHGLQTTPRLAVAGVRLPLRAGISRLTLSRQGRRTPPNAGGVRGKSSSCRALPNKPCQRRAPKEPAKAVATRVGCKPCRPQADDPLTLPSPALAGGEKGAKPVPLPTLPRAGGRASGAGGVHLGC